MWYPYEDIVKNEPVIDTSYKEAQVCHNEATVTSNYPDTSAVYFNSYIPQYVMNDSFCSNNNYLNPYLNNNYTSAIDYNYLINSKQHYFDANSAQVIYSNNINHTNSSIQHFKQEPVPSVSPNYSVESYSGDDSSEANYSCYSTASNASTSNLHGYNQQQSVMQSSYAQNPVLPANDVAPVVKVEEPMEKNSSLTTSGENSAFQASDQKQSSPQVRIEDTNLWRKFREVGTEMIANRSGRLVFLTFP